jgi:small-conductance mechanosensitive channel
MDVEPTKVLELVRVGGVVGALIVLVVTWGIGRVVTGLADRLAEDVARQRLLVVQVASFIRFVVFVGGSFVAFRLVFNLSDELITVFGGTVVVTVGLVLKDQAASVLAGVMLLVEKPFRVGDRVSFGNYYGEIKSIGLRSVRLVTLDDNEVTIPNSKFLVEPVASGNSDELTMLVQQDFYIAANEDVAAAKRIVEESLTCSCYFFVGKPWSVLVNQVLLDSVPTIRLRAKAYVLDLQYEKVFETDVCERVLEAFYREDVKMPSIIHRAAS